MEELLPIIAEVAEELKPVLDVLKDVGGMFSGLSTTLNVATAATGLLSQGIAQAAQAITAPFQQLGSVITPFVQALNPSVVLVFNQAMRSLQATIGVALVPVMDALIGAVREVSGILLPMMQELAPALGNLAKTATELFMPPLRLISDLFQALAPVLDFLTGALKVVADAWSALSVIGRTLFQTFAKFIANLFGGTDLKDVLKSFRNAMQQVVEAVLKLVAYLAKAFGQLDFIKGLSSNLRDMANPKAGAPPAPQEVGFKGFEDIAKTMAVSAFAAMGGGGEKDTSEKEWLQHLAQTLDGVAKDGQTLQGHLEKLFVELADKLQRSLGQLPIQLAAAMDPTGSIERMFHDPMGRRAPSLPGARGGAARFARGGV